MKAIFLNLGARCCTLEAGGSHQANPRFTVRVQTLWVIGGLDVVDDW